jgi:xanthine dehydrogenase accessory factor
VKHDVSVWRVAASCLDAGRPCALLYVVDSTGSSPGRAGFAMTVSADETAGSVGGGPMELRLVAEAKAALGTGTPDIRRQVHEAEAPEASGMICSGEQTVAFIPLAPPDSGAVHAVLEAAESGWGGTLVLGPAGLAFDSASSTRRRSFVAGADWSYREDLTSRDRLHVVGGGHCSLALCRLASSLDFAVTVYDDRPDLPTLEANTWAKHVTLPSYTEAGGVIVPGDDQYVCVMTFGYKTDDLALRSLLPNDYGFLGALGSRAKIDKLMAAYTAEGFDPEWLRRLKAPLGLPIHSQTPAEIAVSIAAQLVRTRNEPRIAARSLS